MSSERSDSDPVAKVGWIPIERWADPYRHRFCEAERHRGRFKPAAAVAAVIVTEDVFTAEVFAGDEFVFGLCAECLELGQEIDFPREPLEIG